MPRGKVAEYDDEVLVEMLADGNYTYVQIAEELGLTETYVGKVARGERRPETPYGVTTNSPGEAPKGSYPLESPPTDEVEAENDPMPAESEVEGQQAVAPDEAPAKGCVKDRGTPEGQIRTYAL